MTNEIQRGQRAELILNDDLFKEAIKAVRDRSIDDFKAAGVNDIDALRSARSMYEATERLINELTRILRDGHYAMRKDENIQHSRAHPPKSHPAHMDA